MGNGLWVGVRIIEKFKRWCSDQVAIKPTGRTYKMWEHNGWGNTIAWWDIPTRQITGHFSDFIGGGHLFVGDDLLCKMQSGKIGRFRISEVKYMQDPKDQFFGRVVDIGYEAIL